MEQIYTIPLNEAFEKGMEAGTCDCPICKLFDKMEKKEVEMALGPAMMEPSNRMITNEKGFCHHHFKMMTEQNNSLSLALVLESHLGALKEKFDGNFVSNLFGGKFRNHQKASKEKSECCYICEILDQHYSRIIENAVFLYAADSQFRAKLRAQKYFCLPHYQLLIECAKKKLDKKKFSDFFDDISAVESNYFEKIIKDVSWYCKKFDYRYDSEPWYDSKDAVDRAIRFLSSGTSPDKK